MVSEAVGVCINVQINRTRCQNGQSVLGGSSGFAFAWLTTVMVAKDSIGNPKSDTKANLKASSLATAFFKLLRVTQAAQFLPGWQPAPKQEGDNVA